MWAEYYFDYTPFPLGAPLLIAIKCVKKLLFLLNFMNMKDYFIIQISKSCINVKIKIKNKNLHN